MISRLLSLSLIGTLFLCACGKEEKKATEGAAKAGESADLGSKATITLAQLDNLKIDVAKDTEPSMMGASVMIMSMEESFTVEAESKGQPTTLEAAKKEATELYNATDLQEETLPDGWLITYKNAGSMGDNYWLKVRREIGGKAYTCGTSVGNKTLRDGAIAACKSLRP